MIPQIQAEEVSVPARKVDIRRRRKTSDLDNVMAEHSLTSKQQVFVDEYLIDLNATQAAIRAGYSAKSADKIASELLGKTRVSEAVNEAMAKRSESTEITAERVLQEYALIAFADPRDTAAWAELQMKMQDKLKALDALAKHLGLAVIQIEHRHTSEMSDAEIMAELARFETRATNGTGHVDAQPGGGPPESNRVH